MSPVELIPEIWAQVIGYLRRPLPPPTGKNERSSIYQPDLACLMRVSKLHNQLTARELYLNVITDHLPSLTYNLGRPPSSQGIQSKIELLGYTTRLFLEYAAKADPSYGSLLRYGGLYFGLLDPGLKEQNAFCEGEAKWIGTACAALKDHLPKLETLSTGVFLGGQRELWKPLSARPRPIEEMEAINQARYHLVVLALGPNVRAFCHRAEYGPLAYTNLIEAGTWVPEGLPLRHRLHLDSADCGEIPGVINGQSRWYCEYTPGRHTQKETDAALMGLGLAVADADARRHQVHKEVLRQYPNTKARKFSVDVYLPASWRTPGGDADKIKGAIHEVLEPHPPDYYPRVKGDEWRMNDLASAPECEACGRTYSCA